MKSLRWIGLFLLLAIGAWLVYDLKFGQKITSQMLYDQTHKNPDVLTKKQVDNILKTFEKVSYNDLDEAYLTFTKSNHSKYKNMLRGGTYYKVPSDSIYQKIVGKNRIRNFLPKDK